MENLLNGNFVNAYFGICIVMWALSLIATVLVCVIKPLRTWYFRKMYQWGKTIGEEYFDVMEDDINELFGLLDNSNEENEEIKDEDL